MDNTLFKRDKYLKKHINDSLVLHSNNGIREDYKFAVVIPVYNELEYIFKTIDSLQNNKTNSLTDILVVLVINNRQNINPDDVSYKNNQELLKRLKSLETTNTQISLTWLDLSTIGVVECNGVGHARKLGMDISLKYLNWSKKPIICCLDADTIVRDDYFKVLEVYYDENSDYVGAVVDFKHMSTENSAQNKAIENYEFYIHYYANALKRISSPYCYYSIGSTITCLATEYIRAGGMKLNDAGEDFYFLQALRKIGKIGLVDKTKVYQSSRTSDRVPFGTGQTMIKVLEGEQIKIYNPKVFLPLKDLFERLDHWIATKRYFYSEELLSSLSYAETKEYLELNNFARFWDKTIKNMPVKNGLINLSNNDIAWKFYIWFDALKTLRFMHFLEEQYPTEYKKIVL